MTVPVTIGAAGPWMFVIDTGAERSVVSRELAESLKLEPGPPLRVLAMADAVIVPSVHLTDLHVISSLVEPEIIAPTLEEKNLGAPGMLGLDALRRHRVDIDLKHNLMSVHPSPLHERSEGSHGRDVVVVARALNGQLIITDASWRRKPVAVLVDTGSTNSIGNDALRRLIGTNARAVGEVEALTVTGSMMKAKVFTVDDLSIGGIGFDRMQVAFADAEPFHRLGLEQTPAIILGMDALRSFKHVSIDFTNRDITFSLPAPSPMRPSLARS